MPAVWSAVAKFPKLIFFPASTNANLQIAELLNAFWGHGRCLVKHCTAVFSQNVHFLLIALYTIKRNLRILRKLIFRVCSLLFSFYLRRMAELLTLSIFFFSCVCLEMFQESVETVKVMCRVCEVLVQLWLRCTCLCCSEGGFDM